MCLEKTGKVRVLITVEHFGFCAKHVGTYMRVYDYTNNHS